MPSYEELAVQKRAPLSRKTMRPLKIICFRHGNTPPPSPVQERRPLPCRYFSFFRSPFQNQKQLKKAFVLTNHIYTFIVLEEHARGLLIGIHGCVAPTHIARRRSGAHVPPRLSRQPHITASRTTQEPLRLPNHSGGASLAPKSHRNSLSGSQITLEEHLRLPNHTGGASPAPKSHRRSLSGTQITPEEPLRLPNHTERASPAPKSHRNSVSGSQITLNEPLRLPNHTGGASPAPKSHRRSLSGSQITPEQRLRLPNHTGGASPAPKSHRRSLSGTQITPEEPVVEQRASAFFARAAGCIVLGVGQLDLHAGWFIVKVCKIVVHEGFSVQLLIDRYRTATVGDQHDRVGIHFDVSEYGDLGLFGIVMHDLLATGLFMDSSTGDAQVLLPGIKHFIFIELPALEEKWPSPSDENFHASQHPFLPHLPAIKFALTSDSCKTLSCKENDRHHLSYPLFNDCKASYVAQCLQLLTTNPSVLKFPNFQEHLSENVDPELPPNQDRTETDRAIRGVFARFGLQQSQVISKRILCNFVSLLFERCLYLSQMQKYTSNIDPVRKHLYDADGAAEFLAHSWVYTHCFRA